MKNPYIELPIYQPCQRKYWDWKEKKPKHETLNWLECIEQTEPTNHLIDVRMVNSVWPFGDDHSVIESHKGAWLVALPYAKVTCLLKKLKF